jgi:hypothetical protein
VRFRVFRLVIRLVTGGSVTRKKVGVLLLDPLDHYWRDIVGHGSYQQEFPFSPSRVHPRKARSIPSEGHSGASGGQECQEFTYLMRATWQQLGAPCIATPFCTAGVEPGTLAGPLVDILGLGTDRGVVVVGAGNVGTALAHYSGFNSGGF